MSSRSNSLAPWRRSQSQIRRWISGSDTRRRSRRGGKRPALAAAPAYPLPLRELLPDQEAVRQHHTHRVAVEAGPQPALVLVPAQQPLGLLVELLHPVPPVRVAHHPPQRGLRAEVAPVVAPLAVRAVLPEQPTRPALAVGPDPPAAHGHDRRPQPTLTPLAPTDAPPGPLRLPLDQGVGPGGRPAARAQGHGEVAADGHHITFATLLQARQEVGVVA